MAFFGSDPSAQNRTCGQCGKPKIRRIIERSAAWSGQKTNSPVWRCENPDCSIGKSNLMTVGKSQ
jgi:hypothetical protein